MRNVKYMYEENLALIRLKYRSFFATLSITAPRGKSVCGLDKDKRRMHRANGNLRIGFLGGFNPRETYRRRKA